MEYIEKHCHFRAGWQESGIRPGAAMRTGMGAGNGHGPICNLLVSGKAVILCGFTEFRLT
jgi:hypothetical protein